MDGDLIVIIGMITLMVAFFGGSKLLDWLSNCIWRRKNRKTGEEYDKYIGYNEGYYMISIILFALFDMLILLILTDPNFNVNGKSWWEVIMDNLCIELLIPIFSGIFGVVLCIYSHMYKIFFSDQSLKISNIFHRPQTLYWNRIQKAEVLYLKSADLEKTTLCIFLHTEQGVSSIRLNTRICESYMDFLEVLMDAGEEYGFEIETSYSLPGRKKIQIARIFDTFSIPVILFLLYFMGQRWGIEDGFLEACVHIAIIWVIVLVIKRVSKNDAKKDAKITKEIQKSCWEGEKVYVYRAPAGARGGIIGLTILLWLTVIVLMIIVPCAMGALETARDTIIRFGAGGLIFMIFYTFFIWKAFSSVFIDIYFNSEKIVIKKAGRRRTIYWHELGEAKVRNRGVVFYDRYGKRLFTMLRNNDGYQDFKRIYESRLPHHSEQPIPKPEQR